MKAAAAGQSERSRRAAVVAAALVLLAANALPAQSALGAEPPVATDTPAATIESLHRGLVALSRDRPSADVAERYRALEPLIAATHDLPFIAEFALRRQWPALGEADRARFVTAFEKLSVTTYASRFKNVTADTFKPGEGAARLGEGAARPGEATAKPGETTAAGSAAPGGAAASGRAQVQAAIVRAGEPEIPLEYLLEQKDGAWRIVNIVADGVSDLALKRAEYQRVLANGTIEDLIEHVDAQAARLE